MLLSDDDFENARLFREQADQTDDPRVARFLRQLAEDYEELAGQNQQAKNEN